MDKDNNNFLPSEDMSETEMKMAEKELIEMMEKDMEQMQNMEMIIEDKYCIECICENCCNNNSCENCVCENCVCKMSCDKVKKD